MTASTSSRGVEVQLDLTRTTTWTSTYEMEYTHASSYTEADDDIASVSVLAPSRLDEGIEESVDVEAVRRMASIQEESVRHQHQNDQQHQQHQQHQQRGDQQPKTNNYRNDRKKSTLNYVKQHPPISKPPKDKSLSQNKDGRPSISKQQTTIIANKKKAIEELDAQMKKVQWQIKNDYNHRVKGVSMTTLAGDTKGGSNCIGSIWSNHVVKITVLLVLYCLIATAIGGWLAKQFLQIPGLNSEIGDLNNQIVSLQSEVDRLNEVLNKLDVQIDELKETNANLEETNKNLEDENDKTEVLVELLNDENQEFKTLNAELQTENKRYDSYTKELNRTVEELIDELAISTATQTALSVSLNEYKAIRQTLEDEILFLSDTTGDLNSTVQELNAAIAEFEEENDKFRTIVSFLEDEANGVQHSYDELAKTLASTIIRKRTLAEIGVKERMKAELAGWECGLVVAFATQEFSKNVNYPIGYSHFDDVVDYVSDKLFVNFCIDSTDFETFLQNEIVEEGNTIWTINLSDFTRGVNIYTSEVLNYYFPDEDDTNGLDSEVWETANYECSKLSQEMIYKYQ